jgi:hypothetical protein
MRTLLLALCAISLCGYADGCLAQPVTDLELRAAYCLGVASTQYGIEKGQAGYEFNANEANKRRALFLQYLSAKGFLLRTTVTH